MNNYAAIQNVISYVLVLVRLHTQNNAQVNFAAYIVGWARQSNPPHDKMYRQNEPVVIYNVTSQENDMKQTDTTETQLHAKL